MHECIEKEEALKLVEFRIVFRSLHLSRQV